MTQIPIISGIYTDESSDFRVSYPKNLIPIAQEQGISSGYLMCSDGITSGNDSTSGPSRAGINWNDKIYRVCGTKLVLEAADQSETVIGDVGGSEYATLDYSFDYLAVASNNNLYLYNGTTLTQVTDSDIGSVIDVLWVDGYFMVTDGETIAVTDLDDPFSVNPLKYGSSEVDPDPIKALLKVRNEPHAVNRYTIESFDNIGGDGFPFGRIEGAQITKGSLGVHTCCVFVESIAFVGSGRNEQISVYLGASGQSAKIATKEIDEILSGYTESALSNALVEPVYIRGQNLLYIHLPDQTLVYNADASRSLSRPVWFSLSSASSGLGRYNAVNHVFCYNRWSVGHPTQAKVGYLDSTSCCHWGLQVGWEFSTIAVYNESRGAIIHDLELVALSGRNSVTTSVSTEYSIDGLTWSQPRYIDPGAQGNRNKRLLWLSQGYFEGWRIQRFKGLLNSRLSFARLEASIEGLAL